MTIERHIHIAGSGVANASTLSVMLVVSLLAIVSSLVLVVVVPDASANKENGNGIDIVDLDPRVLI